MLKIGLKLWATNAHYVAEAERLLGTGIADYIELYAYPNSFEQFINTWKRLQGPYIVHAAHFSHGLCLSKASDFKHNQELIGEALRFADQLQAAKVIVHPGINGEIAETARQLKLLYDPRLLIENKPYYVQIGGICNGHSPEDIQFLKEEANVGFCFDVGHAICAANALRKKQIGFIKDFLSLNPLLFHVSDGDWEGLYDDHMHLGGGSFVLKELIALLPQESRITLETPHDYQDSLRDFEQDALFLKSLFKVTEKESCAWQ
jgi:sugar phosphate isomerase/epimerase